MRVLVADKLPPDGISALARLGLTIEERPDLDAEALPEALTQTEASILLVRSTKVTAKAFEAAVNLSLVVRAGAGVNTIDLDAASRHGVFVANCPGKNAIAVAELTLGLILALDRRLPDAAIDMRQGRWRKKAYGKAEGLHGRKLGLVGFGAIAREVAVRAQAFGMDVGAFSRSLTQDDAEQAEIDRYPSLEALLESCDVVSVHLPYNEQTHHLIGAAELKRMKPGALLIHTARGGIVDEKALADAVASGHVRAGLDVLEGEPESGEAEFEPGLCGSPDVIATPHIGASTQQAQLATAAEAVRVVRTYLETGAVPNVVNLLPPRPARWTLVVRHHDKVGILAGVLGALREEGLNVQEMQNVIFKGKAAASATITLEQEPAPGLLERLRAQEDILAVDLRAVEA